MKPNPLAFPFFVRLPSRIFCSLAFYFLIYLIMGFVGLQPFKTPNAHAQVEETNIPPPIEATTYSLKVLSRSNSNRIYLLEDLENRQPFVGHMILLKNSLGHSVMALRVLKTYPTDKMIAAKWLKKYNQTDHLDENEVFTTIEKVMDIAPPIPAGSYFDELKELEDDHPRFKSQGPLASSSPQPLPSQTPVMEALTSKVQPPPDQSPAQASLNPDEAKKKQLEKEDQLSETKTEPKPEPKPDNRNNDQLEESTDSPDNTSQSVLEVQTYDNYRFWLSAGFGVIQSINPNNSQSIGYLNAGNARFGVTIAKHIYFKSSVAQDSFALEATVFGYKFIGSAADTYTVASVIPTMRYNINFGERFGIFVYGGMSQAFVISGINALQSTLTALTLPIPAFGGGVLFQIGPAWYTRLDAGYESVTLNLLLRF